MAAIEIEDALSDQLAGANPERLQPGPLRERDAPAQIRGPDDDGGVIDREADLSRGTVALQLRLDLARDVDEHHAHVAELASLGAQRMGERTHVDPRAV